MKETNFIGEMFDSLPGLFYVIDDQNRFLRWNKNLETISGYTSQEISRMMPLDFFAGSDKEVIAGKIRKVFQTGDATAEAEFVAKDQTSTSYFFTGRRVQVGQKPCLVGMGIDITVRRRAELKFRHMLEATPDAIVIADRERRIVVVNGQTESMFGYAHGELIGQHIEVLIPDRYRPKHGAHVNSFIAHPRVRTMGSALDIFARRKNGQEFPVEISLSAIQTEDGLMVAAAVRDITERKQAEQELQQLGMAMDVTADSIYLTDPASMHFVYVNNAACQRLGYTRDQLLRMGPLDVFPLDREQIKAEYAKVIAADDSGLTLEHEFVRSDGTRGITELHRRSLHAKAKTLIVTIGRDITDRKRADERIRRLNRVYAVLSGINTAIVRIQSRGELFSESCRIAVSVGRFPFAWLGTLDAETGKMSVVASAGDDRGFLKLGLVTKETQTGLPFIAEGLRTRKTMICNDVENDVRLLHREALLERGFRALAGLPLVVGDTAVGYMAFYAGEMGFFDDEETRLLEELAGDIAFCLDTIDKKEKFTDLVFYDQLTGVANRALFLERLNQSIQVVARNDGKFALALFDIERFSTVNDSLGRKAGDIVMTLLASRLKGFCGPSGVGRSGTDQFALILGEVKGRSQAARKVGEALQQCFSEPFRVAEAELRLSAKAGIALYPSDGNNAELLLQNAEAALRQAKKVGESHVVYAASLTERSVEQLTLENKLRQALEKDEFLLYYQPKVDLETRRIVGVEGLLRWQSPELGLVQPMKFIPLMEQTGLILKVGPWALRQAAADHRKWVEQRLQAPRIAVNVSPLQLLQRTFVTSIKQAIIHGIAPTAIDLEITESLIMEDVQGNIQKLKDVYGLGVRIAIDDFGTGYSSLGYLAKLPVQSLKIDRSFIVTMLKDADTMTLVSTIISLAHALRLKVVAEGVEEEEQAKMLKLLRCDEMQGYLFSKPLPFEQMTEMLKNATEIPSMA